MFFGAQKNCLIEAVLFSTYNICFACEIRDKKAPYLEAKTPSQIVLLLIITYVVGTQNNHPF